MIIFMSVLLVQAFAMYKVGKYLERVILKFAVLDVIERMS